MKIILLFLIVQAVLSFNYSSYAGYRFSHVGRWTLPTDFDSLPSGRQISNSLFAVGHSNDGFGPPLLSNPVSQVLSAMMESFGSVVSHDVMCLKLEKEQTSASPYSWPMRIPECDPTLNPHCVRNKTLPLVRSVYNASKIDGSRLGMPQPPSNEKMSIPSATFLYGCGGFGVNCNEKARIFEENLRVKKNACELKSRSK